MVRCVGVQRYILKNPNGLTSFYGEHDLARCVIMAAKADASNHYILFIDDKIIVTDGERFRNAYRPEGD